jgi:hypothetical protein
MLHLIEHKRRTGVPSVFRTFLEAAVELRNLMKDPGYGDHMTASHYDQWLKVLKEAKKGNNRYLGPIANSRELDELITFHEKQLRVLKTRGKRPLTVFERFERADMAAEYRSLYNFISCDSHSNLRALKSRHFDLRDDEIKVVIYKDEPIENSLATFCSMAELLIGASLWVHDAFNSGSSAEVQKMLEEFKCLAQVK